jgi:hypothetical protein
MAIDREKLKWIDGSQGASLRPRAMPMKRLLLIVCFLILTVGCQFLPVLVPEPTSLPGWRSPVSELFVDESAFPEGWHIDFPEDTILDPTVNHVGRSWGRVGVSGTVTQGIWRAYTAADAEDKYAKLRQSQFHPSRTLPSYELFVEFKPPEEVNFQSQTADEFYFACGWWTWAYCEVVARYRNYVVDLRLDREAEYEGHITTGLTYSEIEDLIRVMDATFAEAMEELYPPSP